MDAGAHGTAAARLGDFMSGDDLNLVSDLGEPSRPIPTAIPVQTDDEEIYCLVCGYNLEWAQGSISAAVSCRPAS